MATPWSRLESLYGTGSGRNAIYSTDWEIAAGTPTITDYGLFWTLLAGGATDYTLRTKASVGTFPCTVEICFMMRDRSSGTSNNDVFYVRDPGGSGNVYPIYIKGVNGQATNGVLLPAVPPIDVSISNSAGSGKTVNGRSLCRTEDNRTHAFYHKTDSGTLQIFYEYSDDYGQTWSAPQKISNNAVDNTNPVCTVDKDGFVHVAWKKPTTVTWAMTLPGGGWGPETDLSTQPPGNLYIDYCDGNGVMVTYSTNPLSSAIYSMIRDMAGSWGVEVTIESGVGTIVDYPSIAADQSGWWNMAYQRDNRIYYRYNNGAGWSGATAVSTHASDQTEPCITNDYGDNGVFVVWSGYSAASPATKQIHYRFYDWGSWDPDTEVTSGGNDKSFPAGSSSYDAYYHIAYCEDDGSGWRQIKQVVSEDSGVTWNIPTAVTTGNTDKTSPSLLHHTNSDSGGSAGKGVLDFGISCMYFVESPVDVRYYDDELTSPSYQFFPSAKNLFCGWHTLRFICLNATTVYCILDNDPNDILTLVPTPMAGIDGRFYITAKTSGGDVWVKWFKVDGKTRYYDDSDGFCDELMWYAKFASRTNMAITYNTETRYAGNPVIPVGGPLDADSDRAFVYKHPSVFIIGGKYVAMYGGATGGSPPTLRLRPFCAESVDGINWTKQGTSGGSGGVGVADALLDVGAPASWEDRYVYDLQPIYQPDVVGKPWIALYCGADWNGMGYYQGGVAWSNDLRSGWTKGSNNPVLFSDLNFARYNSANDPFSFDRDITRPAEQQYRCYSQAQSTVGVARTLGFNISSNGEEWRIWPDGNTALAYPTGDDDQYDLYNLHCFCVLKRLGGCYVGLFGVNGDTATNRIALQFSYDGIDWWRISSDGNEAFIVLDIGAPGSWDADQVYAGSVTENISGTQHYHYYTGAVQNPSYVSQTGLATIRLDGWSHVGLTGANLTGNFVTVPINLVRPTKIPYRLHLNCKCSPTDYIEVEVVDPITGNPVTGFTRTDCDDITTDGVDVIVSWGGDSDIRELCEDLGLGQIQLKFYFTRNGAADEVFLYTYHIENLDVSAATGAATYNVTLSGEATWAGGRHDCSSHSTNGTNPAQFNETAGRLVLFSPKTAVRDPSDGTYPTTLPSYFPDMTDISNFFTFEGDLLDQLGTKDLTNTGGATFVAGQAGQCVQGTTTQYASWETALGNTWAQGQSIKTFESNIYFNSFTNEPNCIFRIYSDATNYAYMREDHGLTEFNIRIGTNHMARMNNEPRLGRWHHMVASWSNSGTGLWHFRDGEMADDFTFGLPYTGGMPAWAVDETLGASANSIDGKIDNVRIWDRAFTETDVGAIGALCNFNFRYCFGGRWESAPIPEAASRPLRTITIQCGNLSSTNRITKVSVKDQNGNVVAACYKNWTSGTSITVTETDLDEGSFSLVTGSTVEIEMAGGSDSPYITGIILGFGNPYAPSSTVKEIGSWGSQVGFCNHTDYFMDGLRGRKKGGRRARRQRSGQR